jgi:hypothetical protein
VRRRVVTFLGLARGRGRGRVRGRRVVTFLGLARGRGRGRMRGRRVRGRRRAATRPTVPLAGRAGGAGLAAPRDRTRPASLSPTALPPWTPPICSNGRANANRSGCRAASRAPAATPAQTLPRLRATAWTRGTARRRGAAQDGPVIRAAAGAFLAPRMRVGHLMQAGRPSVVGTARPLPGLTRTPTPGLPVRAPIPVRARRRAEMGGLGRVQARGPAPAPGRVLIAALTPVPGQRRGLLRSGRRARGAVRLAPGHVLAVAFGPAAAHRRVLLPDRRVRCAVRLAPGRVLIAVLTLVPGQRRGLLRSGRRARRAARLGRGLGMAFGPAAGRCRGLLGRLRRACCMTRLAPGQVPVRVLTPAPGHRRVLRAGR